MTPRPPGGVTERVGLNVRQRREQQGQSQRQIAARLGWTNSMVARIEGGQVNITVEQLAKLARCLGCQPVTLLRGVTSNGAGHGS